MSIAGQSEQMPVVAVAASDFGWGSVGKLRLVLERLSDAVDLVLVARDEQDAATINGLLGFADPLRPGHFEDADVALVINDPTLAEMAWSAAVPVVYVDSLPYLRATADEVPQHEVTYCAQRVLGGVPLKGGPLDERADIVWIEPIVPNTRHQGGQRRGIVLNVGGLHSHLSGRAERAYLDLVVQPLVEELVEVGAPVAAVCGNIDEIATAAISELIPGVPVGRLAGPVFEGLVGEAALLITSPGSTTVLQAAAAGTPACLLPPQNLSQILNTELFRAGVFGVVAWPTSVLDRAVIDALWVEGEDTALSYIYDRMISSASEAGVRAELRERLAELVASWDKWAAATVTGPPGRGAAQVANEVLRLLKRRIAPTG